MFHVFFAAGGAAWIITYALMIRLGFRQQTYCMPLVALCANISWEFAYSFVTPYSGLLHWAIIAWFTLDVALLYQLLRFGPAEFPHLPRPVFHAMVLLTLAIAFPTVLTVNSFFHDPWGVYSAYAMMFLMDGLFLAMLIARRSTRGQSVPITVVRVLGTASITLAFTRWTPDFPNAHTHLLTWLYIGTTVLDLVCLGAVAYTATRATQRLGTSAAGSTA
ncbi:hypothetical protein ACIPYS_21255 [Kitasatospora sp. NPDC089913]|uniref:transmembrane-type terpene cyclase n=1 Tax=Kitasatospora sp. NPDC089913 TaxID=3364080 RepID=UPI003808C0C3